MKCLCCGNELKTQTPSGWHKSCIRKFFGTEEVPEIIIDEKTFETLAAESTSNGFTVPGVQKKISLNLFKKEINPRLTLMNYPAGYILKPQVKDFKALPESEHLVMSMAEEVGIKTVPHALIYYGGEYSYITKRIDRISKNGKTQKLAMEDFCQLDERLTADKYRASYEQCSKIINKFSSRKGLDMTELFLRLIFSFIVGNSDMHLKNFSLIETSVGSNRYILSAAYDLLPLNIIMPEDKEEVAMPLCGKKKNITRNNFLTFAINAGVSRVSAEKMIEHLISKKDKLIALANESLLPKEMKEALVSLIILRTEVLKKTKMPKEE